MSHTVLCPTHGPLIDLKRHCHNIYRFFLFSNLYEEPSQSANWFQIASGITEVKYISDLYDEYSIWCGPSIEYEGERSKFHSKLILELTRFNFIWGGLESFYDELNLENCPKYSGKINAINYALKAEYLPNFSPLSYYVEVLQLLKDKISANTWCGDHEELFKSNECTSKDLIGLKVVYKIRNLFAHGNFKFSEPHEWNPIKPHDIVIISASSRIVLLTIQMLIKVIGYDLNFLVATPGEVPEENGVDARNFLEKMHLKEFDHS